MNGCSNRFPQFPHVRQAFGMDINQQEHCLLTGLNQGFEPMWPGVISGEWSNNWVPNLDDE